MTKIYISLDDVKGIFKALNSVKVHSVFETRTLSFLRDMHLKYGTLFQLYCTYNHGEYSLNKVSSKFRKEFEYNADWLQFGFHCIDELEDYSAIKKENFQNAYNEFMYEMYRVTGQNVCLKELRLHKFAGNIETCRILHKYGVDVLFASDDERKNYYLPTTDNEILLNKGEFYDTKENIKFVRSCTRLENTSDVELMIREKIKNKNDIISIFTHECKIDNIEVRKKFEICCKIEQEERKMENENG